jgi:hypothetical protein
LSYKIRVEKLKSLRAAFFYSFTENPEEDAWINTFKFLKNRKLLKNYSNIRVFGRNIYPTEDPEPHGYAYYITINSDFQIENDCYVTIIPGGLYTILPCRGFEELSNDWSKLWKWVENSNYKYIGETKSELGFELGYEEILNWYGFFIENKDNDIFINLMIQLCEE